MANVNDIYEARIVSTYGVQSAINVRHYQVTTKAGTGATDLQFAQALDGVFAAEVKALMNVSATYRGVGVRRIVPAPVSLETSTIANAGAGTTAGDALPLQIAGVISLRTLFGGRRYRGRLYVPFASESDSDGNGNPQAGYIAAMATFAASLRATFVPGGGGNTNTFVPGIYSRSGSFITAILSTLQRASWGTMRSRGGFGRANPAPF